MRSGKVSVDCSDENIFALIQQGDHGAFEQLLKRYQDRVYSTALKVLRHPQDAQDAAQQAFLQVWQKRHYYDPRWRFSTWLYRIVINICIDEYRRRGRRGLASEAILDSVPAADCPARDYERMERKHALSAGLAQMPLEDRIVLVLCYLEGMSHGEVARVRGISVHTVKKRLHRAKALLRESFERSAR